MKLTENAKSELANAGANARAKHWRHDAVSSVSTRGQKAQRPHHEEEREAVRHAEGGRIRRAVFDEDHAYPAAVIVSTTHTEEEGKRTTREQPTTETVAPRYPRVQKHGRKTEQETGYSREREAGDPRHAEEDSDAEPEERLRAGVDALNAVLAHDNATARDDVEQWQQQVHVRVDRDAGVVHLGVVETPQEVRHAEDLERGSNRAGGRKREADFFCLEK